MPNSRGRQRGRFQGNHSSQGQRSQQNHQQDQNNGTLQKKVRNTFAHPNSVMIAVTSRSIGFCTADAYNRISSYSDQRDNFRSIYGSYRAFLALLQTKVYTVSHFYWVMSLAHDKFDKFDYQEYVFIPDAIRVPSSIAALINAVCKIEINSKTFVPFVAPNTYTPEGKFIPQSEHVYLSNLRETVVALQSPDTAVEYRREFYDHNPIPGTVWRNAPHDPILMNADEVIPANYNVSQHLRLDLADIEGRFCMYDSDSNSVHCAVKFESINVLDSKTDSGVKTLLKCSRQVRLRVLDRLKDQNLKDYCHTLRVDGEDYEYDFQNLVAFTEEDKLDIIESIKSADCIYFQFLLGERPVFSSLCHPHYVTRDSLLCCQYYENLTFKAIPTCVTTRSIGFGVAKIFQQNTDPVKLPEKGNIYQVYRTCLYLMQLKILRAKINCRDLPEHSDDYQFYLNLGWTEAKYHHPRFILEPIANSINSVGLLKVDGTFFLPVIITDSRTKAGAIIPQSEHVFFYNLREIVVALANENTSVEHRRSFYENNPIPGTKWQGAPGNPVLINPGDVMPQEYAENDLLDDFNATSFLMSFIRRSKPELKLQRIDMDAYGKKGMLTCNDQNKMRIADCLPDDELEDYYKKLKIEGFIGTVFNYVALHDNEQLSANTCLLGERPVLKPHRYPHYVIRDERVCVEYSRHHHYEYYYGLLYPQNSHLG